MEMDKRKHFRIPVIEIDEQRSVVILDYGKFVIECSYTANDHIIFSLKFDYLYISNSEPEVIKSVICERFDLADADTLYQNIIGTLDNLVPGYERMATLFGIKIVLRSFVDIVIHHNYSNKKRE